jgi:hypothetical protein
MLRIPKHRAQAQKIPPPLIDAVLCSFIQKFFTATPKACDSLEEASSLIPHYYNYNKINRF